MRLSYAGVFTALLVTIAHNTNTVTSQPCNPDLLIPSADYTVVDGNLNGFLCVTTSPSGGGQIILEPGDSEIEINANGDGITILQGAPGDTTSGLTVLKANSTLPVNITAFTDNNPAAIRVAFADRADGAGLSVGWSTATPLVGIPTVYFDTNNPPTTEYFGTSMSYQSSSYYHYVQVYQLDHATTYYYRIAADPLSNGAQSDVYSIRTSRAAGDTTEHTMAMVGDFGLYNGQDVYGALNRDIGTYEYVVHIGDISYADDFFASLGDTYEGVFDKWQTWMTPITANRPYMTEPGNHEAACQEVLPTACPTYEQYFTPYRYRFRMNSLESGSNSQNMWQSFDYGQVHWLLLNSETDYPNSYEGPGSNFKGMDFGGTATTPTQMAWLEGDLAKVNRSITPWVIATAHRPLYSSDTGDVSQMLITAFEGLFTKYNVDFFFAGHIHWYERMYPIRNGVVTQRNYDNMNTCSAPIYIVNGAGGQIEDHTPLSEQTGDSSIDAFLDYQNYGYGTATIHNDTALTWKFIRGNDSAVLDEITFFRTRTSPDLCTGNTVVTANTTATPTPTATAAPSGTATATATATPTATSTSTPIALPPILPSTTATPASTATQTAMPSATATSTPSAAAIVVGTGTPTATHAATATPISTSTAATSTASAVPTATGSSTVTATPSTTGSTTPTAMPSVTAGTVTATAQPSATATASVTAVGTSAASTITVTPTSAAATTTVAHTTAPAGTTAGSTAATPSNAATTTASTAPTFGSGQFNSSGTPAATTVSISSSRAPVTASPTTASVTIQPTSPTAASPTQRVTQSAGSSSAASQPATTSTVPSTTSKATGTQPSTTVQPSSAGSASSATGKPTATLASSTKPTTATSNGGTSPITGASGSGSTTPPATKAAVTVIQAGAGSTATSSSTTKPTVVQSAPISAGTTGSPATTSKPVTSATSGVTSSTSQPATAAAVKASTAPTFVGSATTSPAVKAGVMSATNSAATAAGVTSSISTTTKPASTSTFAPGASVSSGVGASNSSAGICSFIYQEGSQDSTCNVLINNALVVQCYNPVCMTCTGNALCPVSAPLVCGNVNYACYDPAQYTCVSGSLQSVPGGKNILALPAICPGSGSPLVGTTPNTATVNAPTSTGALVSNSANMSTCNVIDPTRAESPWHGSSSSYPQVYDTSRYVCVDGNFLCPSTAPLRCGYACYTSSQYACTNETLSHV